MFFDSIGEKKRKLLIAGGIAGVMALAGVTVAGCSLASSDMVRVETDNPVYIHVTPGMGSSEIADMLVKHEVVDSKRVFQLVTKLNGADGKFQTGVFQMEKNMKASDALNVLVNGYSVAVRVTIPEGLNVREVAKLMDDRGLVDKEEFLAAAKDFAPYDYIESVPNADYRIEGFLFPDTYEFGSDATAKDIMQKMADEFDRKLTPEMRQKAAELNMSIYQLITMASLVEKEARYAEDRPIIAQVFASRMAIDMPLQTDTTLQYLLDEAKEDLTIADTKMESPYNTYLHYGLPPGPIASPGMASIEAVLSPADTDYLFFVADREGHNHYTHTYSEHLEIVEQVR